MTRSNLSRQPDRTRIGVFPMKDGIVGDVPVPRAERPSWLGVSFWPPTAWLSTWEPAIEADAFHDGWGRVVVEGAGQVEDLSAGFFEGWTVQAGLRRRSRGVPAVADEPAHQVDSVRQTVLGEVLIDELGPDGGPNLRVPAAFDLEPMRRDRLTPPLWEQRQQRGPHVFAGLMRVVLQAHAQ